MDTLLNKALLLLLLLLLLLKYTCKPIKMHVLSKLFFSILHSSNHLVVSMLITFCSSPFI